MKKSKIIFYHLDKYGRKIQYLIDHEDVKDFKLFILERSFNESLGPIYMETEEGEFIILDYYNL